MHLLDLTTKAAVRTICLVDVKKHATCSRSSIW